MIDVVALPGVAYRSTVRGVRRQRPNGEATTEIIIVIAQRIPIPFDGQNVENGFFWYGGGTTVVIDPSNRRNQPEIKYTIWKRIGDDDKETRLVREREFRSYPPAQDLRGMYFGTRGMTGNEPFAALHSTEY